MPKHLQILVACPLCSAPYNPREARILGEQKGKHLLHIECKRCGNAVLAVVLIAENGISSLGMVTDLTAGDTLRFKDSLTVSVDDVLGLHEALGKEDFIRQLKQK